MYLGIDIGTSSVKAVLIDADQRIVASQSEPLEVERPHPDWSEQDPDSWVTADLRRRSTRSATDHPDELKRVRGIGLSGHMHGATLLDQADRPLRPCILWNDGRSSKEAAELDADPRFRKITGNIVFPGFTAPKLVWVHRHEPKIFGKVAKVLLPKDYVRLWLSGDHASDMSDSAGTSWLDVAKRDWSDDLLAATHLARDQMPKLYEGTEPTGKLRGVLATRWGMTEAPVIAGGAGDNAASACGVGTVAPGAAFVSLGTSGVLFVSNENFRPNAASAVHAFCHALPNTWHQMGVILSAAASLEWLSGVTGASAAELAESVAEAKPAEASRCSSCPTSPASARRTTMPARAALSSACRTRPTARRWRARCMEGVAFAFADCLAALQSGGHECRARDRCRRRLALARLAEDHRQRRSTSRSTFRPRAISAAAFGAARLGLIAAENADPLAICTPPEDPARRSRPSPRRSTPTATPFERYRALYPAIKESLEFMSTGFFGDQQPIRYEGPESRNPPRLPLVRPGPESARQADGGSFPLRRLLLALLRLAGHRPVRRADLRCARGSATTMEKARLKADVAFEMFELLGVPFFTFHDRDIAPEGATLAESNRNVREIADIFAKKMQSVEGAPALGHGEPLLQPPLHGGRRHQSRPGDFCLRRRAGEERARRDA